MSSLPFEPTDIATYHALSTHLEDKISFERNGVLMTVGNHPICGGKCAVAFKENNPINYHVSKPHRKCNPFECIDFIRHECTGGGSIPLPEIMLDCNR